MIENNKHHYYRDLDLLKRMMVSDNKKTVDDLFNLQFSLFFNNEDINEKQIKILSRLLCREDLDSLLQSTWFLRKKHCSVAMSKKDIRDIIELARISSLSSDHSFPLHINWNDDLDATVNITEHLRLIQAVIKPLFIWWVNHITPQLFSLYETKRELELQINQCNNIKLFEEKQPSNNGDSFLSLDDINIKLDADKIRLILINELLNKDIQLLLNAWKSEPIFTVEIKNTLEYIQAVSPRSEILKPLWVILRSIPEHPENCQKLKNWLLERSLCLNNDNFLWRE
ncbi:T3SS regulon anti-activator ExsD domain-containing protein [Proteus hauseri]|uniref:T3SS regulon anti-activator ExsD domain-containing protein n=1 Tax=Proteus hauseri TaxID=183417 RepID=UPI0032DAE478